MERQNEGKYMCKTSTSRKQSESETCLIGFPINMYLFSKIDAILHSTHSRETIKFNHDDY